MAKRRNILFITADQWRADCLSTRGHAVVKTPTLDALARDGTHFRNHFANTAPCSPSRATLHTGLYQHNHRVAMNGTPLDKRHTNWALEMRRAGLDPALIGYTDQTPDPRGLAPDDPRLRTYEGVLPGLSVIAHVGMESPGPWADYLRGKGYDVPEDERFLIWMREQGPEWEDGAPHPRPFVVKAEDNDTAWPVDQAIDFVRARKDTDWVLHLSLLRPHPPWIASEPWNRHYDPAAMPESRRRETHRDEGEQHPWLAFELANDISRAPRNPKKLARLKAVYYGLMAEVDHHLGRLFATLRQEGVWDDTLIVFTSDHGEMMGDHWMLGKSGYFDQAFAVPLIVRDPAAKAKGGRIDAFSEAVDVMPTLLTHLGLPVPPQCDGRALQPFLNGTVPANWRDAAHWEFDFRDVSDDAAERALGLSLDTCNLTVRRTASAKYVHFAGLPPLYFDLAKDPHEFENRANDPAWAAAMLKEAQALLSWRLSNGDRTLTHYMASENGLLQRGAR